MIRSKFRTDAKRSKFSNVKTEVDGIIFHSKREAKRFSELKLLERAGAIKFLLTQPKYPILVAGKKIATYIADFVYLDLKTGKEVIEDSKGFRTEIYRLKKKLVEAQYGIEIQEV